MDKEKLEARIAELKAIRDQHLANANTANGAVLECQYWLGRIASHDAPAPASAS